MSDARAYARAENVRVTVDRDSDPDHPLATIADRQNRRIETRRLTHTERQRIGRARYMHFLGRWTATGSWSLLCTSEEW